MVKRPEVHQKGGCCWGRGEMAFKGGDFNFNFGGGSKKEEEEKVEEEGGGNFS